MSDESEYVEQWQDNKTKFSDEMLLNIIALAEVEKTRRELDVCSFKHTGMHNDVLQIKPLGYPRRSIGGFMVLVTVGRADRPKNDIKLGEETFMRMMKVLNKIAAKYAEEKE